MPILFDPAYSVSVTFDGFTISVKPLSCRLAIERVRLVKIIFATEDFAERNARMNDLIRLYAAVDDATLDDKFTPDEKWGLLEAITQATEPTAADKKKSLSSPASGPAYSADPASSSESASTVQVRLNLSTSTATDATDTTPHVPTVAAMAL